MAFLNEDLQEQLQDYFSGIKTTVNMHLIVDDCDSCDDSKQLLEEVSGLNDHIKLTVSALDSDLAERYGIARTPVIFFTDNDADQSDLRIRYNGIPAGHEFSAFINTIAEVGGAGEELPQQYLDRIAKIDTPVNIKVFVTLACPHCSGAVAKAHKLALLNPNIVAEMIECGTFPALSDQYEVSGVPKIVINEAHSLLGNQPLEAFLDTIEKL